MPRLGSARSPSAPAVGMLRAEFKKGEHHIDDDQALHHGMLRRRVVHAGAVLVLACRGAAAMVVLWHDPAEPWRRYYIPRSMPTATAEGTIPATILKGWNLNTRPIATSHLQPTTSEIKNT